MYVEAQLRSSLLLVSLFQIFGLSGYAQNIKQLCNPVISDPTVVASAKQRLKAGNIAEPPLTDTAYRFAWPDTALGVLKTTGGDEFFGSDGGLHWTTPVEVYQFSGQPNTYVMPMGTDEDPHILGKQFYLFYTYGGSGGWPKNYVGRLTVTCHQ